MRESSLHVKCVLSEPPFPESKSNEYHSCSFLTASHQGHFRARQTEIHKAVSLV
jgi:hypothetical protein